MGWGGLIGSAIGGGAGFLIGGPVGAGIGMGIGGGIGANVDSEGAARDATAANITSAREAMAFQERMSGSAHQREIADLKAAGLNPILSANAGASTPSGSSAQAQMPDIRNVGEGAASSAISAIGLKLQAQKQAEEIGLIKAQKTKTQMDTAAVAADLPYSQAKGQFFQLIKKGLLDNSAKAQENWKDFYDTKPKKTIELKRR